MSDRPSLQEHIEIKPGVGHIKAACLSPDNRNIAVGGSSGCVEVYRTDNGHCVGSFQPSAPKEKITDMKISLGGITSLDWVRAGVGKQTLCVGTTSGWVALYSKSDNMVRFSTDKERLYEVFPGQAVINTAYDAGRFVFVSSSGRLEGYKHAPPPSNAPWQPLGGLTSSQEAKMRSLSVVALSSDQDQWNWHKPLDHPIGAPIISSDQTKLLAQRKETGIYELYKFPRDGAPSELHYSPAFNDNGYVYIYDTRSGDRVQTLEYQKGKISVRTILAANSGVREVILTAASDDEYGHLVIWRGTFASPRWIHPSNNLNRYGVVIALTLVMFLSIVYFSDGTLFSKCSFYIFAF
uniref:WD40 repeat-like protein n=1 Tax=Moniliophthora roreri TaxID=221103 RepID=A0A0W0G9B5_MONRR